MSIVEGKAHHHERKDKQGHFFDVLLEFHWEFSPVIGWGVF
jgi:hypothetical protein